MHMGRWFCSSCLGSGTLSQKSLRGYWMKKLHWYNVQEPRFRSEKSLHENLVQARCREPLRASHTLPFPDLWLVDKNNWFAPFLRFDHLQVSFTPPRVEYMRIQLYGMSQCLQTELVPRLLNHLEHFQQRTHTHDTHTITKKGTPDCLLTSNKLTIQSLVKFYGKCCQEQW